MRTIRNCPLWITKATSLECKQVHVDQLFEELIQFLTRENISYVISSKHYKVRGRLTSFVDYVDFTIQLFAAPNLTNSSINGSTEVYTMEWTQQNGSRSLFWQLFRAAEEQFVHVANNNQVNLWDLPCDLSPQERCSKWKEIISNHPECMQLDVQYQYYYALVLIAQKLDLKNLQVDTVALSELICKMCSSSDYEIIRFGCLLLSMISFPLPEAIVLLKKQFQKIERTFQTTHVLKAIESVISK